MTDDEKITTARDTLARLTRQLDRVEDSLVGKRPGVRADAVYYSPSRPALRKRPALPPLGYFH